MEWKKRGVKTVFDINVNFFEWWGPIPWNLNRQLQEDAWQMAMLCDQVLTTTDYLAGIVRQRRDRVSVVAESIDLDHWNPVKKHDGPLRTLLLCAIGDKIKELLLVKDVLEEFASRGGRLLLVSDKETPLDIRIPQQWRKWDLAKAPAYFLEADAQVAPRDLSMSYNQGHSLTKVAQGMHMGLPAIASPVPSYVEAPCLLATSQEDWRGRIAALEDPQVRVSWGSKSRDYVKAHLSPKLGLQAFLNCIGV